MPQIRTLIVDAGVMTIVALVLAALGPFGSFGWGDFGTRLAYWWPACFLGYVAFRPAYFAGLVAARRLNLPEITGAVAGVAIGALPASLLIFLWTGSRLVDLSGEGVWFPLYVQVALIGALALALLAGFDRRAVMRGMQASLPDAPGDAERRSAPFLNRLPADIARDLVALEMEDHYVRAHAPGRSTLLLMRMRDAEAELAGVPGLRVHRSWWVAQDAVVRSFRQGRNLRLKLRGGLEAPVGRDRAGIVRQAGWIGEEL